MTRIGVGWLVALLLGSPARGEPPPCLLSADAPTSALVGQQVVLTLRTLRRPDVASATWGSGRSFPGFRVDPLPGVSGDRRVMEHGASYLVFEERLALFPVRAGRLELPPVRLQCMLHALPGTRPRVFDATLPARPLSAVAPPEAGRPKDYAGLVGSVSVSVEADARHVALGDILHVIVSLEGDADLRDATTPFGSATHLDGAELFATRPELDVEPRELLRLRRRFHFTVVPRSAGLLVIPSVRIPYFDPATRRYDVAASAPLEIRVDPRGGR